jgi:hypothetical protein
MRWPKWSSWRWLLAGGALVVLPFVVSVVALFFLDEPLRRYTEGKMNASLKGYSVTEIF